MEQDKPCECCKGEECVFIEIPILTGTVRRKRHWRRGQPPLRNGVVWDGFTSLTSWVYSLHGTYLPPPNVLHDWRHPLFNVGLSSLGWQYQDSRDCGSWRSPGTQNTAWYMTYHIYLWMKCIGTPVWKHCNHLERTLSRNGKDELLAHFNQCFKNKKQSCTEKNLRLLEETGRRG